MECTNSFYLFHYNNSGYTTNNDFDTDKKNLKGNC